MRISGKTSKYRLRIEDIRYNLGVAPVGNKIRENHL